MDALRLLLRFDGRPEPVKPEHVAVDERLKRQQEELQRVRAIRAQTRPYER